MIERPSIEHPFVLTERGACGGGEAEELVYSRGGEARARAMARSWRGRDEGVARGRAEKRAMGMRRHGEEGAGRVAWQALAAGRCVARVRKAKPQKVTKNRADAETADAHPQITSPSW